MRPGRHARQAVTQTVIGTPGVYDPQRNAIALTGGLAGWDRPAALAGLREAFGPTIALENDVDAAALAERTHGYGRDRESFAFVHIGTGIGMGLVLGGGLHRGVHGVAGEIAFMPLSEDDSDDARRRGPLEAAAAAAGVVRAARKAGMRGPVSARSVFAAAAQGDERAKAVVAEEARLVARAICTVITVVDPGLIVLGGGIGQAPGFAAAVSDSLRAMSPVMAEVKVSALGSDVVVDGCLAEGASLAWNQLTSAPRPSPGPRAPSAATTGGDYNSPVTTVGEIAVDDPRRPEVRALLERHLAFCLSETPPEHSFALDVDALVQPGITFVSYRDGDGTVLGVAAIKELDAGHAELKSMHTAAEARGRGVGRAVLGHLLRWPGPAGTGGCRSRPGPRRVRRRAGPVRVHRVRPGRAVRRLLRTGDNTFYALSL